MCPCIFVDFAARRVEVWSEIPAEVQAEVWAGVQAEALDYWSIPLTDGDLVPRTLIPGANNEDFSLSRLTAQLRYRWEIGPLSDLFVVYTRGSNFMLDNDEEGFGLLFNDAIDDPILDFLVLKLRYRFGT